MGLLASPTPKAKGNPCGSPSGTIHLREWVIPISMVPSPTHQSLVLGVADLRWAGLPGNLVPALAEGIDWLSPAVSKETAEGLPESPAEKG